MTTPTHGRPAPGSLLTRSGNFTTVLLIALDIVGILLLFNLNHWIVTGAFAPDLLLTWKLVLVASTTFLFYYLMDLYAFDSMLSQLGMLERSFIAILLTGIAIAALVYAIGPSFVGGFVGRGVLAGSLLTVWLWSLGARYLLNIWVKKRRRNIEWLVVADGDLGEFLQHFRSLYAVEHLAILMPPDTEVERPTTEGAEIAGTWHDLEKVLWERDIAGIIVTAPDRLPEMLISRLMAIRIGGIRIFTLSDFYEKYLARLPIFHLDQRWLAMAHGFELIHNPIGLRFKRYIDILVAVILGVVLAPVMLLIAISIVITSGLPIFYQQERVGENGRKFMAWKFRTMVPDAESAGAQFTTENDPRVTRLGRLLRKFRADELPQLWNVLAGDMSFIGPRPERPEFIAQLQRDIPHYSLRHVVKPGITGWAQVMYGYGDTAEDAAEKLQYDLFYIKNYSLMLDISILLKTIKVVLFGTGR